MTQVLGVIKSIEAAVDGSLRKLEDTDRIKLLDACGGLRAKLETPLDAIQRILLSVCQQHGCFVLHR